MKICLLSNALSIHTKRWVDILIDKGFEVYLVSFRKGELSINCKAFIFEPKYNNFFYKTFYFVSRFFKIKRIIKQINPDIVHSHYLSNYGLLGALIGFKPLIVSAWGSDLLVYPDKSFFHKKLTSFVLKKAALVTVMAEHMRDKALQLGCKSDKIMKVSLGIDLNKFNIYGRNENKKENKNKSCLMVGTRVFEKQHNNEYIIEALFCLKEFIKNFTMYFYGNGSRIDLCKNKINSLSLGNFIRFFGNIPYNKIPDIYKKADIYVAGSTSDGDHVSLMEAMACGVFPVVTDIPANREWIKDGENGFLVPLNNAMVFAKKLKQAIKNKNIRKKAISKNFNLIKKKASFGKDVEKLIQVYFNLTKTHENSIY